MPSKGTICEALGCNSNTRNKTGPFFLFPIDPKRKRKWEENIKMKPPSDRKLKFLCSRHFSQEAFVNSFCWKLSSCAVPTKQYGPFMYKMDMYDSSEKLNNEENLSCSERFHKTPGRNQLVSSLEIKAEETALRTSKNKIQSAKRHNNKIKTEVIALSHIKNKNQLFNSNSSKVKTEVTTLCHSKNNSPKKPYIDLPIKAFMQEWVSVQSLICFVKNKIETDSSQDYNSDESSSDPDSEDDDLQFFKAIIPFIRYLPYSKKMNVRMKIQEVVYGELYGD